MSTFIVILIASALIGVYAQMYKRRTGFVYAFWTMLLTGILYALSHAVTASSPETFARFEPVVMQLTHLRLFLFQ